MGVLSALMQHDLKRLLAYHTVENIGIIFIGLGLALAFSAHGMQAPAALALTAALFHVFNHCVFKSLLFFGAGAVLNATGRTRHGAPGRPHPSHARHRFCLPHRLHRHLGAAAAQRLRLGVADLPGDPAEPGAAVLGPQDHRAGGRRHAGAVGGAGCRLLRQGLRRHLPRPAAHAGSGASAHEVDRASLAAMLAFAVICLLAGILPGLCIDALSPVTQSLVGAHMPVQAALPWLSIVPIAESRSSYNGLLVFIFIALATILTVEVIHRFASRAVRRGPAWDCGYPDANPATQYTADSFAQPIRRVFGEVVFKASERVDMPAPGDRRPARLIVIVRDLIWEAFYAPIVGRRARSGRPPQPPAVPDHPPIPEPRVRRPRRPPAGGVGMALIRDLALQGAQMLLVLVLAPLLLGFTRKVKARLLRRRGPPVLQPYRDLLRLIRKEAVIADNASWLFRSGPYMIFSATWVAAALIPTFATGLTFSWAADLIAITALIGSARFFLALVGMDIGTSFGGIGSSREMMFASLAEPAMIMIVFTVALVAGSTQLSNIANYMLDYASLRVSLGLALVALIIVAVAENARIPVDNPATHLELTMVHEAMVLEYSGRHLAMIELAAAVKLLLYVSLIACIFFPWGLAQADAGLAAYAIGAATYVAKLFVGGFLLVLFETSIAKMRVFRVPDFLGVALMLGLLGTLLLFVSRSFYDEQPISSTSPTCWPAAWCC